MPKLVNHRGDDGVLPRELLCYTRRKRPRHASPFFRAEKKHKPGPCSLDAVPDEVLREILRRLPGNQERSVSALVSKRWLMLLNDLEIGELVGMTDDMLLPVIWTTSLVKVNLRGCANLTVPAICTLVVDHGWRLQVLKLQGCCKLTDRVLLEISRKCTGLKQLDMSGADVTDYGVALLASARLLKVSVLSFAGCAKLTAWCLPLLANMGPTLVRLNLQNCDLISEDDIASLEEDMEWCDIN